MAVHIWGPAVALYALMITMPQTQPGGYEPRVSHQPLPQNELSGCLTNALSPANKTDGREGVGGMLAGVPTQGRINQYYQDDVTVMT